MLTLCLVVILTFDLLTVNFYSTTLLTTAHTVGCAVELSSGQTAATILADTSVTPTDSEMTENVSTGTINHTHTNANTYY